MLPKGMKHRIFPCQSFFFFFFFFHDSCFCFKTLSSLRSLYVFVVVVVPVWTARYNLPDAGNRGGGERGRVQCACGCVSVTVLLMFLHQISSCCFEESREWRSWSIFSLERKKKVKKEGGEGSLSWIDYSGFLILFHSLFVCFCSTSKILSPSERIDFCHNELYAYHAKKNPRRKKWEDSVCDSVLEFSKKQTQNKKQPGKIFWSTFKHSQKWSKKDFCSINSRFHSNAKPFSTPFSLSLSFSLSLFSQFYIKREWTKKSKHFNLKMPFFRTKVQKQHQKNMKEKCLTPFFSIRNEKKIYFWILKFVFWWEEKNTKNRNSKIGSHLFWAWISNFFPFFTFWEHWKFSFSTLPFPAVFIEPLLKFLSKKGHFKMYLLWSKNFPFSFDNFCCTFFFKQWKIISINNWKKKK